MQVHGACHCGRISYEAEVDTGSAVICHCSDCQTLSGTPFRTVLFTPEEDIRMTGEAPRIYHKVAESGRQREQAFCPHCGTPIYSAPVGESPRTLGLRVGAMKERDNIVPVRQIWHRSAQSWLDRLPGIECVEKQ